MTRAVSLGVHPHGESKSVHHPPDEDEIEEIGGIRECVQDVAHDQCCTCEV